MARKSNEVKTLKELELILQNIIPKQIISDGRVEKVLQETMQKAVQEVVYDAYVPKSYKRRGSLGGLGDPRLMQITEAITSGNEFMILFENLAKGQDSLDGKYISETIENGIASNWYKEGVWSEPRPFVRDVMNKIMINPTPLIEAVKLAFTKAGFKVR